MQYSRSTPGGIQCCSTLFLRVLLYGCAQSECSYHLARGVDGVVRFQYDRKSAANTRVLQSVKYRSAKLKPGLLTLLGCKQCGSISKKIFIHLQLDVNIYT